MQSAFVDLGLERDAFLYVSDVISPTEALEDEDEDLHAEPPAPADAGGEAVATGEAPAGDRGNERSKDDRGNDRRPGGGGGRRDRDRQPPSAKIEDLLKEGQEVVVQVVKEPLGTKGARITSHLSLPGRFLVFMPTVDHVGVSRKIESRDERRLLRTIIRSSASSSDYRQRHHPHGRVNRSKRTSSPT